MTSPALARCTAVKIERVCFASVVAKLASTKSVASGGGKGRVQSSIGTHEVEPSVALVPGGHADGGTATRQPQPLGSFSKGASHAVQPTGLQPSAPRKGAVPAGQSSLGSVSAHEPVATSRTKPTGQSEAPRHDSPLQAAGGAGAAGDEHANGSSNKAARMIASSRTGWL